MLSSSRRALTSDQATAFALLGIAPSPDLALPAAASLTGLPPREAKTVLRGLEQASLLNQDAHGRYSMHDLIRDYAATTADHDLTEPLRETALRRVVDFYLHTAHSTDRLLNPHEPPLRLSPPEPGTRAHALPDVPAALAWLDAEAVNLLGAQHIAITRRRHQTVWHLAMVLRTFHHWQGRLHDGFAMWRAALDASGHLPEPATRSTAHRILGYAYSWQGRHEEADGHLREALDLAEHHRDLAEQAHTHQYLAVAWERRADHRLAREHAERALALYRTIGRPMWEAQALNSVGWYAACLGDHDTARGHCRAALTLHRRHRDPTSEANTLGSLGFIDHRTGRHHRAIGYYRQALALFREHGNTAAVTDTLDTLGRSHG